ncbi:MAG TPA: hypothetical protein DHV36_21930 [Desulfobacteraceae bacterium]|nr:hypothetical protein [Desulfobacteraceae bacterium]
MRINSNYASQQAIQQSNNARSGLTDSLNRIATGNKINKGADDASGMMIASSLKSQSLAMGQAMQNANEGISITQVADGALGEMTEILHSIRTNVLAAANGSQSAESLQAIQSDINGSISALNDIVSNTSYNGQSLLSGSFTNKSFSMGEGGSIGISIASVAPDQLGDSESGFLSGIDVTSAEGVQDALDVVDLAMEQINQTRSTLGSTQNQFGSAIQNMGVSMVNLEAAQSQIMDTDLAEEVMVMKQMENLEKASTFALSKANSSNDHLLNLIA